MIRRNKRNVDEPGELNLKLEKPSKVKKSKPNR